MGEVYQMVYMHLLAPGRYGSNYNSIIVQFVIENSSLGIHDEFAHSWMPENYTKSTLV